jgi:tetratricopeptide (TPR) repeat protein
VEEVMARVPAGVAALEIATAPRPLSGEAEAPPEVAELIVGVPAEVLERPDHEIHEKHEMAEGVAEVPAAEAGAEVVSEAPGVAGEVPVAAAEAEVMPEAVAPELPAAEEAEGPPEAEKVVAEMPPATVTTPSGGASAVEVPPAVEPAAAGAGVRPNVLYARAMEHYRNREWPQARHDLLRLKAADPARPGLDALIDDVEQFIQSDQARQRTPGPEPETAPVTAPPARPRKQRSRMPLWQAVALGLVVLAVAGGALAYAGVLKLPGLSLPFLDNRVQTYINRGYDSFTVDDYQAAMDNFNRALELDPDNEEAKLGLQHATQYLELRVLYTEARALMEQKSFDEAIARLQTIIATDPWYEDADLLLQQCENAKKLEDLYTQALSYYSAGDWAKATDAFEALQGKGVAAGEAEVRSKLFDSYLNEGRQQVAAADSRSAIIRATLSFNSALALFPDDEPAQEERQLASLYLDGYTAYERADWRQAAGYLARLCATRADYAQGRAARLLCESYMKQGDAYQANGQLQPALDQYRLVQAVALCDQAEVSARIQRIQALLAPTPTPAATP